LSCSFSELELAPSSLPSREKKMAFNFPQTLHLNMILIPFSPQNLHPLEIRSLTSFVEIKPADVNLESAIEAGFCDPAVGFCCSVVIGRVLPF